MRMIFDLFDKLLNSEVFCFFHNCMWTILVPWSQCRAPPVRVSPFLFWSSSSIFAGIPLTGLPVLVECLTSSWSNKIPFSISFVDSCPPTGLAVLDNWSFLVGFVGYLCCFQRLLNPILSSNYLCGDHRWWSRWHIYFVVYEFSRFHHEIQ